MLYCESGRIIQTIGSHNKKAGVLKMLLLSSQLKKSSKAKSHVCNPTDKYCQEGANPYRHPDHDSHITGCNCMKGKGKYE